MDKGKILKIGVSIATVGITITTIALVVNHYRQKKLGLGQGLKEAKPEDKENRNIIFTR